MAQRIIRGAQQDYWRDYCSTLNNSTKLSSVWKTVKNMSGTKSKSAIPNLTTNGIVHVTDKDKADVLAETFAAASSNNNYDEKFQQSRRVMEEEFSREKHQNANRSEQNNYVNEPFKLQELKAATETVKKNSSPGADKVHYEMLKNLHEKALNVVLQLYNNIWQTGKIPNSWKHSVVIPIHKKDKPKSEPQSYRPIALTSALCKLMEKMISNRLSWFMERNNLFNNRQSGFRNGRSTIDQIIRLQDTIYKSIDNQRICVAVFFDFEKAYDMLYREGLLHKIRNLGLTGNIYQWIDSFLLDRSIQVRVGGSLSDTKILENGTPQGSSISPLLFLIMINDFPPPTDQAEQSIFADDSAIWKDGKNIDQIGRDIQKNIDSIVNWTNKWGVKISTTKTVGIIFTRRPRISLTNRLHILQQPIRMDIQTKFLGMIFDSRLTWAPHIKYLVDKCKKRLNIIRCLSGTGWGASKSTQLTLYRALIRSCLDYGAQAFNSAAVNEKKKLDTIQYQALRTACGAMHGTALEALQVECGEPGLQIRRIQQQLQLAVKIEYTQNHPAKHVLYDCWQNHYGRNKTNNAIFSNYNKFRETMRDKIQLKKCVQNPTWKCHTLKSDTSLRKEISKSQDSPETMKMLSMELISSYNEYEHIYTDGSKTDEKRTGFSFWIPKTNYSINRRLTDNISVYACELIAIREALSWIRTSPKKQWTIFSDSLSAIQSIEKNRSTSRPNLIEEISDLASSLRNEDRDTILVWIPSHVNISGNEMADKLAKEATERESIEMDIGLETNETTPMIIDYVDRIWQNEWTNSKVGKICREIQPTVSRNIKYSNTHRATEVLITRIRLGRCRLNYWLHQIRGHTDGLCEHCLIPETIQHYLINCTKPNSVSEKIDRHCQDNNLPKTLRTIANNQQLLKLMAKTIDRIL